MTANQKSAMAPKDAKQRHWARYAAGAVIVVLALAYIDAGEEPIRPIIQPVELPAGGGDDA